MLECGTRLLRELGIAVGAALISRSSRNEQRNENYVEWNDRAPEMNFSERFIEHSAEHFRVPEGKSRIHSNNCDGNERVMEMRDDEIRIVQINVRAGRAQENSRHAPNHEFRDESQGPEHGSIQVNRTAIESRDV